MSGKVKRFAVPNTPPMTRKKSKSSTSYRNVFGIVVNKNGSYITVDTGDHENGKEYEEIDLKRVHCDAVLPIVGDFINIKISSENPFAKLKIEPWKMQTQNGSVKYCSSRELYGIFNESVVFFTETLPNLQLCIGDRVKCQIIRGRFDVDGKKFEWRCCSVELDEPHTPPSNDSAQSDLIDFDDFLDKFQNQSKISRSSSAAVNDTSISLSRSSSLSDCFDTSDFRATINKTKSDFTEVELDELNAESYGGLCVSDKLVIDFTDSTKSKSIEVFILSKQRDELTDIVFKDKNFQLKNGRIPQIFRKGDRFGYVFEAIFIANQTRSKKKIEFHFASGIQINRTVQIIYKKDDRDTATRNRFDTWCLQNYDYSVPDEFIEIMLSKEKESEKANKLNELVPMSTESNMENYAKHFHDRLYLEELEMLESFDGYRKCEAYFSREDDLFDLEMQNLFERRPSIKIGDKIFATKNRSPNVIYRGIIRETYYNRILIKFETDFDDTFNHEAYSVEFSFTRTMFIRKHIAVDAAIGSMVSEFLFPTVMYVEKRPQLDVQLIDEKLILNQSQMPWFNAELNTCQTQAVKEILRGDCRSLPFIIYGPPGTGKTSVLIEVILQLCAHIADSRLIVVANSNSAVDLIAQRLLQSDAVDATKMLRIVSYSVLNHNAIPDNLLEYCATIGFDNDCEEIDDGGAEGVKKCTAINLRCNLEYVKKFRIVITTNIAAGAFMRHEEGFELFTHAIIDEAGQCMEPDTLIPLVLVGKQSGQVIMAGDPMQLSPMVMSRHASKRGLGVSMMSRLLDRYLVLENAVPVNASVNSYDPRLVVKLLFNYRSLPCILDFYNKQFYNSELIAKISSTKSREAKTLNHFRQSKILPLSNTSQEDHGIFFVNVCGENKKLSTSPSWCNPIEAQEIASFVPKLIKHGLNQNDIGIITPYHLQVRLLRKFLEPYPDIRIGTIEDFQGQERKVILISAVRTSRSRLMTDINRNMGFVQCPKRINVALSRARTLISVYGKADLLLRDENWSKLIDDCKEKGTFINNAKNQKF